MKILIIENDTYLAQSICNQFIDAGYECKVVKSMDSKHNEFFDVILASYDVCEKYENLLKCHPNSIIIMMIKYMNDSTVTKIIKAGVDDYVLKPFSVAELIRKIEHYKEHSMLQKEVVFYKDYFEFIESILNTPIPQTYKPPFVIKSHLQRSADIYAMRYARSRKIRFDFLSLKNIRWKEILKRNDDPDRAIYITGLERLKKSEQNEILSAIPKRNIIFSYISQNEIPFSNVIDLTSTDIIDVQGDILSIKDYERLAITKYEAIYSDIELAKKLGMSRKSLWEKRKKYGIMKKRGDD